MFVILSFWCDIEKGPFRNCTSRTSAVLHDFFYWSLQIKLLLAFKSAHVLLRLFPVSATYHEKKHQVDIYIFSFFLFWSTVIKYTGYATTPIHYYSVSCSVCERCWPVFSVRTESSIAVKIWEMNCATAERRNWRGGRFDTIRIHDHALRFDRNNNLDNGTRCVRNARDALE